MTLNQAGLDLIKQFEGFRAVAYQDSAGVWTVGYGHTGTAKPGMAVSEAEAEQLLRDDVESAERAVDRLIDAPLNENQFAALVSFTFNVGQGALERSTLRRKLNNGIYDDVPFELSRWNKAGGEVLRGLQRRRTAEAALWRTLPQPDVAPPDAAFADADPPRQPGPLARLWRRVLGIFPS